MYKAFRGVDPFFADNSFIGDVRISDTQAFHETVIKRTGMTVEQARIFFYPAHILSQQQGFFDAAKQRARAEDFNRNKQKYIDQAKEDLRQCQLKLR